MGKNKKRGRGGGAGPSQGSEPQNNVSAPERTQPEQREQMPPVQHRPEAFPELSGPSTTRRQGQQPRAWAQPTTPASPTSGVPRSQPNANAQRSQTAGVVRSPQSPGPQPFQQQGAGGYQPQSGGTQQSRAERPQQPSGQPQTREVTKQATDRIVGGIEKLNIGGFQIPLRKPQRGEKKGKPIVVETNHFALTIRNPKMLVIHYDVAIEPEKPFRFYRPALEAVRKRCYPNMYPAFDGRKNLYSYPELPIKTRELCETVHVYDDERQGEKEVKVTIKYANSVDISVINEYMRQGSSMSTPQEAIQALDIVLRQPAANRFVSVGRSFFSPPPGRIISLGDGMDLWYGFFQSAIIGWKPYLNVDVAHKGFPTPSRCLDILQNLLQCDAEQIRNINPANQRNFLESICGLKVVCEIPNNSIKRTYKVLGLEESARRKMFTLEDKENNTKKDITVEKYYQQAYRYQIKFPDLPCLKVGSVSRPISVPLELCSIMPGQVTNKKLNENQTRVMIKEAAVDTDRRKDKILRSMRNVNFNSDPTLKQFGLSISESFTKVPARILQSPSVEYKDVKSDKEVIVKVDKGVWRLNNTRFLTGADLGKWCILSANRRQRPEGLGQLEDLLINLGKNLGLNISKPYRVMTIDLIGRIQDFFRECEKDNVKLVIVILPDMGVTYAQIKKTAEIQVGILTQCIKSSTMRKLTAPTVTNLLLKINAKLNGTNHRICRAIWPQIFQRPVMIVGADVTHPSPGSINIPSIAAVAASHDPRAFKYNMIWKLQPPRVEVISELKSIIRDHLMFFYKANNRCKPERIIVYRDGVSEGFFQQILDVELNAIRQACSELEKTNTYQPKITFLVVQKRHHTRFFPAPQDADGRNKNVPAGTIVDSEITHPTELDFYLVSHASIQGTARPTKYHLLWDDSDIPEQELEEITYYLCHLFARCTRSVSIPAPTYYAHLAAFRARSYTETEGNQVLNLNNLAAEQLSREIKPTIKSNNPMFFV